MPQDEQDPENRALVITPKSPPATQILPNGSVSPFNQGSGTYAVTTGVVQVLNIQVNNAVWIKGISITPSSSAICPIAFFFRYGSWTIGVNKPVLTGGQGQYVIFGVSFNRNFKDGTGRYPQLNAGDTIQLILIGSGSGYVTLDIDAEYVYAQG